MLKIEKKYWSKGVQHIAGVDEAGRGPLAGPVVAACVIFKPYEKIEEIKDSKKLSEKKRAKFYDLIFEKALSVGIGIVHENEIDKLNILQATFLAMNKSIGNLSITPEQVLVDGPYSNIKLYPTDHIIKGDNKSQSIAAASIIAKVTRDVMMREYDKIYPEYNFSKHKGYGTKFHIEQIVINKSSPIHRKSFKIAKENFPDFNYFKTAKGGFDLLGSKIVATSYIKKLFTIIDTNLSIDDNHIIDYLFLDKSTDMLTFLKVITVYDIDLDPVELYKTSGNRYIEFINQYVDENNLSYSFTFDVISIEFIKSKKPKIIKIN
jgi:ribonuclease HII